MTSQISDTILSQLSEFIASIMGLHFPESKWSDLERKIKSASAEFGYKNPLEFISWFMSAKLARAHIEILSSHLTVGETYFFRNKKNFEILEEQILPELIGSRQDAGYLRIWSAGCSGGEEAHSIAILLKKMIPDINDWKITILATDINPHLLKKGVEGIYTDWSFRSTPSWVKEGYFKKTEEGNYRIIPVLKNMVMFEYLNLAEDVYPSLLNNTNGMDIIFCHNVLMYFSPKLADRVVNGFYNSLVDKGWLLVGPTDFIKSAASKFAPLSIDETVVYRKLSKKVGISDDFQPEKFAPYIPFVKRWIGTDRPLKSVKDGEREKIEIKNDIKKEGGESMDLRKDVIKIFEQGRYDDAVRKISGLSLKDEDKAEILSMLVRGYANQGRLNDALKWCEEAISSDKLNPYYHYLLATIFIEQGRMMDAVKSLKKTIYLDNDFILAYFMLGNLMVRRGKLKTSKRYFRNAIELLSSYNDEEVIPESDGITAGRLSEIIESIMVSERTH